MTYHILFKITILEHELTEEEQRKKKKTKRPGSLVSKLDRVLANPKTSVTVEEISPTY